MESQLARNLTVLDRIFRSRRYFLKQISIGLIALVLGYQQVEADPAVDSIIGELSNGSEITILGSGFGSGPRIVLYDGFEDGTIGEVIPLTSPTIGAWSEIGSTPPVYSSYAHSGRSGFLAYDGSTDSMRQMRLRFPATQEIFLSYWVLIPPGTRFPGIDGSVGQFSTDSSWKFAWLIDGADGYAADGKYDMCLPSHIGHGFMDIAGNDGRYQRLTSDWWSWDEWMRVSVWLKGTELLSNNGESMVQTLSKSKGMENRRMSGNDIFFADVTRQFTNLNVPGWIRPVGGDQVQPVYDDIYVAVGPFSSARVELTNNQQYDQSTDSIILIPVEWADTKIVVRLDYGNMDQSDPLSIHVIASDMSQSFSGTRICTNCPKPPVNLDAN